MEQSLHMYKYMYCCYVVYHPSCCLQLRHCYGGYHASKNSGIRQPPETQQQSNEKPPLSRIRYCFVCYRWLVELVGGAWTALGQ